MIRFLREAAAVAVCAPLGLLVLPLVALEDWEVGSRLWNLVGRLGDRIVGEQA